MCVFENRQQDVKVTLAGEGERRQVTGSEIGFEGKKIWVALLEAPHIWHTRELKPADTGKVIPLDWKMPFPAQWRVDFTRPNDLTDSWEMLLQEKNERRVPQAVLARRRRPDASPPTASAGTPCWARFPTRAGPIPTAGLFAAAQEQGAAVSGAGDRLPDQPRQADAARRLHGGGRDAQHPGRRAVRAHPRPGRAEGRIQGPGDLLRCATRSRPSTRRTSRKRNAPRWTRPSTRG